MISLSAPVQTAVLQNAEALFATAQRLVRAIDAVQEYNAPRPDKIDDPQAGEKARALFAEHDAAEMELRMLLKRIEKDCLA